VFLHGAAGERHVGTTLAFNPVVVTGSAGETGRGWGEYSDSHEQEE